MNESNAVELDTLFDEANLFEIYRKAPSYFSNSFNSWTFATAFGVLASFAVVHICIPSVRESVKLPFADIFAVWANLGASLAGTILGFLIAGFSIVCTILRPQTMIALQKLNNKKYKQTELKLLFVLFVDVLVQYLALLLVSIIATVIGGRIGIAAAFGTLLGHYNWLIPFVTLHVIFVAWGTWLVMLVLTLKSFIYNLYQSLLLGLADAVDDYQRQKLTFRCERNDGLVSAGELDASHTDKAASL